MERPSNNFEAENVNSGDGKRANYPLDVAEQTMLLAVTREHFQVIQVLDIALLVMAMMVPFLPLWCKYHGVGIGLNRMMLGEWVGFGDVTELTCTKLNVTTEVCGSAVDFYRAGAVVRGR